jgi:Flp pilus assembly pilin Flp
MAHGQRTGESPLIQRVADRAPRTGWLRAAVKRIVLREQAATAVEYAVMLALILGIILGSIALVGLNTKQAWNNNNTSLQNVGFGS